VKAGRQAEEISNKGAPIPGSADWRRISGDEVFILKQANADSCSLVTAAGLSGTFHFLLHMQI
jgi:hypothetical protein